MLNGCRVAAQVKSGLSWRVSSALHQRKISAARMNALRDGWIVDAFRNFLTLAASDLEGSVNTA